MAASLRKACVSQIPIVVIMGYAVIIRIAHLAERGLWFWDEGIFLMGARFLQWRTGTLLRGIAAMSGTHEGFPTFLGKPGFVTLLSVWEWITHLHSWSAGVWLSIIFSLLTILLVYHWGVIHFNRLTGIGAALTLTLSSYYLYYSRSGLHEIASGFFLTLGFYLLFPKKEQAPGWTRGFWGGLCLGIALICSYRLMLFLPLPWLALTMLIPPIPLRTTRIKQCFFFGIAYAMGILLPILATELEYRVIISDRYLQYEQNSYFDFMFAKVDKEGFLDMKHIFFYPGMLSKIDGVLTVALYMLGLSALFIRRKPSELGLGLCILVPGLLFSFTSTRVTRGISALLPLIALVTGMFLSWLLSKKSRYLQVAALVVVLIWIGLSINSNYRVIQLKSGYSEAFAFFKSQNARHFSTMMPVSAFFSDAGDTPYPPYSEEELRSTAQMHQIRYLLVDWQKYVWYHPAISSIEERYLPVKAFKNPYVAFPGVLNENYLPDDALKLPQVDATIALIKIYDLWQIYPELSHEK